MTRQRAEAVGSPAPFGSSGQDPSDLGVRHRSRRTVRPGAAIGQPDPTLRPEAADPLVAGRATDALRLGSGRHRPTQELHPRHQQLATKDVETCSRMSHESLLTVWCFNTPYRAWRLSFVNNVFGDDS